MTSHLVLLEVHDGLEQPLLDQHVPHSAEAAVFRSFPGVEEPEEVRDDLGGGFFLLSLQAELLDDRQGVLLLDGELDQVGQRDEADGDEEHPPDRDQEGEEPPHLGVRHVVAVADRGHRDPDEPDAVEVVAQVVVPAVAG